jgi:hypothetical protein
MKLSYPPLEGEGRRAPATRSVVRKRRGGVAKRLCPELHPTPSSTSLREPLADPPPQGEGKEMSGYHSIKHTHFRILATAFARGLQNHSPLKRRGRREDRVRAAPAVSCANAQNKTHMSIQFSGSSPAFPAQWFTAYAVLSPVRPGLFVTVAPKKRELLENLTPATGASGPHDFAVRFSRARQSQLSRPPLPAPTSVTMANAPLSGQDGKG